MAQKASHLGQKKDRIDAAMKALNDIKMFFHLEDTEYEAALVLGSKLVEMAETTGDRVPMPVSMAQSRRMIMQQRAQIERLVAKVKELEVKLEGEKS